jgi:hypothetical protein
MNGADYSLHSNPTAEYDLDQGGRDHGAGQAGAAGGAEPAAPPSSRSVLREVRLKLILIPLIFVILRVPETILRVYEMASSSGGGGSKAIPRGNSNTAALEIMEAVCNPAQGIVNAMFFVFDVPESRRHLWAWFESACCWACAPAAADGGGRQGQESRRRSSGCSRGGAGDGGSSSSSSWGQRVSGAGASAGGGGVTVTEWGTETETETGDESSFLEGGYPPEADRESGARYLQLSDHSSNAPM